MKTVIKLLTILISIACSNNLIAMHIETKVVDQPAPVNPKILIQQDLDNAARFALYMRALNTYFVRAFEYRQWNSIQDLMEKHTYSSPFHTILIAQDFYWAKKLLEKAIMWERWKLVFLLIQKFDYPPNQLPTFEEIRKELEILEKDIAELKGKKELTENDQNWLTQENHRRKYLIRIKEYLAQKMN